MDPNGQMSVSLLLLSLSPFYVENPALRLAQGGERSQNTRGGGEGE